MTLRAHEICGALHVCARAFLFVLLTELSRVVQQKSMQHLIRQAFLAFFVSLFRGYRKYIKPHCEFAEKNFLVTAPDVSKVCL